MRAVAAEVRLLHAEQARLARGLRRDDAPMAARAEPRAERRTLADLGRPGAVEGGAPRSTAVGGRTTLVGGWQRTTRAWSQRARTGQRGGCDGAARRSPRAWRAAGQSICPRAGALAAAWPNASREPLSQPAPLDVAFRPGRIVPRTLPSAWRAARAADPDRAERTPTTTDLVAHGGPEVTIPAAPGQTVAAPVEGKVVFAGSFKSYGLLLILEHEGEYHTLLCGFARQAVRQGDQVQVGRIVGIMDARGDVRPVLHVERRRRGRPVDIAASSNGIQG